MGDFALKALVVVFFVWVGWSILRPQYTFEVRVTRGQPRISRGKVTGTFLSLIREVCESAGRSAVGSCESRSGRGFPRPVETPADHSDRPGGDWGKSRTLALLHERASGRGPEGEPSRGGHQVLTPASLSISRPRAMASPRGVASRRRRIGARGKVVFDPVLPAHASRPPR